MRVTKNPSERSRDNGGEPSPGKLLRLLMRVPVPWVFVLAFCCGAGLQALLPPLPVSPSLSTGFQLGGTVLLLLGAVLAGWGLFVFRRARTTTVPGDRSARLVTKGPYRITRNPMYLGLALAYLGEEGILSQFWPLLFLILTIAYVNWTLIPLEESRLREVFGDRYDRYREKVRRWL